MAWIGGADGCKYGWFRASFETQTAELRFDLVGSAAELVECTPRLQILAVDIPIGMRDAGQRDCDREARKVLGWPRRNSVFPAPVRPAIRARSREEASQITRDCDGRGVGSQAWGIYPKIREMDEWLQSNHGHTQSVREVHPEVCFWAWAGKPMSTGKKTKGGKTERLGLAEAWLGPGVLSTARTNHPQKHVADDDILDAIAALWTALRIFKGKAGTLPDKPPVDARGFRMEIVY